VNPALERMAAAAQGVAATLPLDVVRSVASALADAPTLAAARALVSRCTPHPDFAAKVDRFLVECERLHGASPMAASWALLAAAVTEEEARSRQVIHPVWTGPEVDHLPFRRTEQAILEVLDSAQRRITLVSYAVYSIPRIRDALVRAAARGVETRVIVETPDRLEGEREYSTLRALGSEVAACASVYYWPREARPHEGAKVGSLHVKCAVADGTYAFISSANLTEYAFTINMELGVLVRGGPLPGVVEGRFGRLIERGLLQRI